MASSVIKRITETAEKLYTIRKEISVLEEANKVKIDVMKTQRDLLQETLLVELNRNGLASIKVSSGDNFSIGSRKSLEIKSEAHALKWAIEHEAVTVNKILITQKLKDVKEIPSFFEWVDTQFISVRKAKNDNE